MSNLLFTMFIIAAASVDRCPAAWPVCLGSLGILYLLGKREEEAKGKKRWDTKHVRIAAPIWIRMKNVTAGMKQRNRDRKMETMETVGRIRMNIIILIITRRRKSAMNDIRIKIEGLEELTEAVRALAGIAGKQTVSVTAPAPLPGAEAVPVQQMPAPASMAQNYGQTSMQSTMTAGMGVPGAFGGTVPGTAVPTTAMPQEYTLEQLQVAAGLSGMGKMPQVMGILQRFGIQAMTELPKERFGEFAIALREAGAQI